MVILAVLVEFVAVNVDAGERLDEVLRLMLIRIAIVEELRRETQQRSVERHIRRFAGAFRQAGKVEIQPLRVQRRGECDEEDE